MIAEDTTFCLPLIGKPWQSGASGPEAFDCWGLVRFIFDARRGVTLPQYPGISESGKLAALRNFQRERDAGHWEALPSPAHFAVVAMAEGKRINHVGLWLSEGGGGVIHSAQGRGVAFQSLASLRQGGLQNFTFYRFRP